MERLTPGTHALWPTVHATVIDAPEPGPTAVVQGGIHGDEVAGVHALQELLEEGLSPRRGRLVVVPVMNPPAYRARTRSVEGGLDLNRAFPGDPDHGRYEPRLAARFLSLYRAERPALVATLHESHKRYDPALVPSFGQTLVYGVRACPPLLERVVDDLNAALEREEERWATLHYPVATSSTEILVDTLQRDGVDVVGVCVETWMGFAERRRIDLQKDVVRRLLGGIGSL